MGSDLTSADYRYRIAIIDRITVSRPNISKRKISSRILVESQGVRHEFDLIFSYKEDLQITENLAGLILTMPVINFTYFTKELLIDFEVSDTDVSQLNTFININNREVFVNAICRRRYDFYRPEAIPGSDEITEANANGITKLTAKKIIQNARAIKASFDNRRIAVLSSGGKESLLTYSVLKEKGFDAHPIFFNESGAHWRAAKPAFDYFTASNRNTTKVWSNADRFYRFCLGLLPFLNRNVIMKRTDTYPVQLFTFPVYIMSMVPVLISRDIPVAFMGNEFDDPKDMPPFHGIRHYHAIFDQTPDFTNMISSYLLSKGFNISVSSIVYPVTATIVERILIRRYPEIFLLQRSCHSCSSIEGKIIPCGKCSKCMGIIMLILGSGEDPEKIGYKKEDIENAKISSGKLRLDSDEIEYLYSVNKLDSHVTGIHVLPFEEYPFSLLPKMIRQAVLPIFEQYTSGVYDFDNGVWKRTQKYDSIMV